MSTRRVGSKRCSFIRSMTSTPPALIAAPLTVRAIASSTEEACVHSKLFIASRSFLCQCIEHDGRGHGKLADARGVGAALAPQLLDQMHLDLWRLLRSGDLVLLEIGIHHDPGLTIQDA